MHRSLQGGFLLAGTAIGAGMLALPLSTGLSGYGPSLFLLGMCALYSLATLRLLLEGLGYQSHREDAGFFSLSEEFSSLSGRWLVRLCYVSLLFAVNTAYIIGGGQLLQHFLMHVGLDLPLRSAQSLFAIVFASLGYCSMETVSRSNQLWMLMLIACFLGMSSMLVSKVSWHALICYESPLRILPATTVVLLSFACHNLLPSLIPFFQEDRANLHRSLLYGVLIPLLLYAAWNGMLIGILPLHGDHSLEAIARSGATGELSALAAALEVQHPGQLHQWFAGFAFSAVVTSFVGVMLSLRDFLAESLFKQGLAPRYRMGLGTLLAMLPSWVIALTIPHAFTLVIAYAGVLVSWLFGWMPIIWVIKARRQRRISRYPSGISTAGLIFLGINTLGILALQIFPHLIMH